MIDQIELIPTGATIIDRADRDLVAGFHWRLLETGHQRYAHAEHGRLHLYLHRLILGAGPDELVDHENGNGLDNRRVNLRLTTRSGNGANRGCPRVTKSSRYKGVSWDRSRTKWLAFIHVQGRSRSLGRYTTEIEAALAYDVAAEETWGEFARLNLLPHERASVRGG